MSTAYPIHAIDIGAGKNDTDRMISAGAPLYRKKMKTVQKKKFEYSDHM